MKTEIFFHSSDLSPEALEASIKNTKAEMRITLKSDLKNHRFALIGNKSVEDSSNWDSSWFTAYE